MARYRFFRVVNIFCNMVLKTDKRSSTVKTLIVGFFMIFLLHWLIKFEQIREHGDFADLPIPIPDNFEPLGITEVEELPYSGTSLIPNIIHQTWKDTEIPRKFQAWVQSWRRNHPDWTYILWTDESARELIAKKYPAFLSMYDSYPEPIRRADALRYFILYEYGGVYADMDLESLKSLVPLTFKYHCVLAQEPYEHSILDGNFEHLVINAFIACRKGHPFMKMMIDYLPSFSHMWNVLDSTGPHFMTFAYRQYSSANNFKPTHKNGTYLAPAEYFFPTIDPAKHFWMRHKCGNYEKLGALQKRACVHLKTKGVERSDKFAFTTHHWIHTYLNFKLSFKGPLDIQTMIPDAQVYPNINFLSALSEDQP